MKVEIKYMAGEEPIEQIFITETSNDCARGMYNILNHKLFDDETTAEDADELFRDPSHYRDGGKPGDLKSFVNLLADRYENLKYIAIDDEVILDR